VSTSVETRLASRAVELGTGVRLHYVEQGDEGGKPLILLHGITDSWRSFELILPLISGEFRVYAPDQRGHGDSSKPARGYAQEEFAADVGAFMDALGLERATVVGHSMGSLVASRFAAENPSRVEKLVLVGSATTARGNPNIIELNDAARKFSDPVDPEFVREFQLSTFAGERGAPREFVETAVGESLKVPAAVWKQAFAGLLAADHSDGLTRIEAPTLVVFGDRDGVFFYEDNLRLASLIPRATFRHYHRDERTGVGDPGHTGHAPHVEWPEEFVRDLEVFLR
jgi:non-heme chloroperoxidase